MKRWILFLIVFLVIALPILYTYSADYDENNIRNGNIQYSEELGWINWKHANPYGTKVAYSELQRLNIQAVDSFNYTYSQTMKYKIGNSYVVAECSESRIVKPRLTAKEEQLAFFEIFKSVSNSFEKMQAKFPFKLIPESNGSSFREGDLMGNLISYYCSVSNTHLSEIKHRMTLYDSEKSLEFYHNGHFNKSNWDSIDMSSTRVLIGLDYIFEMTKKESHCLTRMTTQNEKFYFE